MGSDSDLPVMKEAGVILEEFGVPHEMLICSAHRAPVATHEYATTAVKRGIKVIIAGAGGAAHLAGVLASLYPLPVIGVPIKTPSLGGNDSLYATVQMPPGVPVATLGIDAAKNAGLLAVQILSVSSGDLRQKFVAYKRKLAESIEEKNKKLQFTT